MLGLADVVEIFFEHYANGDDLITMKSANGKGLNALQIATMNKRNHVVKILLRRYVLIQLAMCMCDNNTMV